MTAVLPLLAQHYPLNHNGKFLIFEKVIEFLAESGKDAEDPNKTKVNLQNVINDRQLDSLSRDVHRSSSALTKLETSIEQLENDLSGIIS